MDWSVHFPAYIDHSPDPPASQHDAPSSDIPKPAPLRKPVTVLDIGCGFGGLLVALSPLLPDDLIVGLEIRAQVTQYVQDRIQALRAQASQAVVRQGRRGITSASEAPACTISSNPQSTTATTTTNVTITTSPLSPPLDQSTALPPSSPPSNPPVDPRSPTPTPPTPPPTTSLSCYENISILRHNTMKFLPNLIPHGTITHIFLCFPDPHFKQRKKKQRIVSETLVAEYAYVLREGGTVWCVTDVEELAGWMEERFRGFGKMTTAADGAREGDGEGLFEKVTVPEEGKEEEWIGAGGDVLLAKTARCIRQETEESKKVTRNGGRKFVCVWRRRADPKWPGEE